MIRPISRGAYGRVYEVKKKSSGEREMRAERCEMRAERCAMRCAGLPWLRVPWCAQTTALSAAVCSLTLLKRSIQTLPTGDRFAIKVMTKTELSQKNMVESVTNEKNILALVRVSLRVFVYTPACVCSCFRTHSPSTPIPLPTAFTSTTNTQTFKCTPTTPLSSASTTPSPPPAHPLHTHALYRTLLLYCPPNSNPRQANNPFVVRFYYSFTSPDKLFLVMEFCPGGDLSSLLQVCARGVVFRGCSGLLTRFSGPFGERQRQAFQPQTAPLLPFR
jgi:serine/threonine protein kinase